MERIKELAELIERNVTVDGTSETCIPGLRFVRASHVSEPVYSVYEPSLCIVAQGTKLVMLGEETYQYDSASYLTASVHLPITGQVVVASPEEPYLCINLQLDMNQIFEVIQSSNQGISSDSTGRGLEITLINESLLEAVLRLIRLLETPKDIPVLAASIKREIIYRILQNDENNSLKHFALVGSQAQRIAKVIGVLNREFAQPLKVEDLAKEARMSASSFYQHFKEITGMSPIQYQKQLRLQEARRMLLTERLEAAEAAFQVGYESPSHFSREYSRMFGLPPMKDIQHLWERFE
ncbi:MULTISPECIES: AraC family transcriptional regulator [Bacillaceae]|uniref:AraC family transcriptional regulator n=1 Tax=Psychrobacillus lasiicapitis TaxID=1636719 RepID=A0A544SWD8_9BACI|nr:MULTISPECIES: AraC family transcriptional regulator [Bacillaceae]TQR09496.1 AraC family transcriptional regulator [Psychrobacillus lasiicapitis]GGA49620.1 AraC family transcriptional regulator [Psychrobacillus lasiicapitis]